MDLEGKEVSAWREMANVHGLDFAPDGRHLAITANGAVYILRLAQ